MPPFSGAGLLHSLLASSTPPPQLREQPSYGLQAPQRPFTCTGARTRSRERQTALKAELGGGAESHLSASGAVPVAAGASVADPALAAAGPVGPGEVAGLADQLVPGRPGAPELGAGLHEGAGPGAGPEGQLTLALQVVAEAGEAGGQRALLLGLVQQTVAWRTHRSKVSPRTSWLLRVLASLNGSICSRTAIKTSGFTGVWSFLFTLHRLRADPPPPSTTSTRSQTGSRSRTGSVLYVWIRNAFVSDQS